MNCLLITNHKNKTTHHLEEFFLDNSISYEKVNDSMSGIQRAQEHHFDVVVLDAGHPDFQVDKTIRLINGVDPSARIIVHTKINSRDFETAVRKEKIFYFHVTSLGLNDLKSAVKSALHIGKAV